MNMGIAMTRNNEMVLVARVTVGDETQVVEADKINDALLQLSGTPHAGMRIQAHIDFDVMTEVKFAALPEYQ